MKKVFFLLAMAISTMAIADYTNYNQIQNDVAAASDNQIQYSWKTNQDKAIAQKIRDQLANVLTRGFSLTADVKDGQVTINGNVVTAVDKQKIDTSLRNISGITRINNQVIVAEQGQNQNFPNQNVNTLNQRNGYDAQRNVNANQRNINAINQQNANGAQRNMNGQGCFSGATAASSSWLQSFPFLP